MVERYVEVAVAAPVDGLFTYAVPPRLQDKLSPGHLVEVPFGGGTKRGLVMTDVREPALAGLKIKNIQSLVEDVPVFNQAMIRTLAWAAEYYLVPPGEMVFAALPPMMKRKGASRGEKKIRIARLSRGVGLSQAQKLEKRAPLQSKILRMLAERGALEVAALAATRSGARQALGALKSKGLVIVDSQVFLRRPEPTDLPLPPEVRRLTAGQQMATQAVFKALKRGGYSAFLLHGVTGSGKTEVYLRAIQYTLRKGQGAILLVPEISLTPQLVSRVTARFGQQVAVLHSGLGEGERLDEWRRLQGGRALVAVGARSAVFAPIPTVGLVVVDEEHDASYKQSERIPYNGRDLAMVRAREENAVVLMGTATPSMEAYTHASRGRSTLLCLNERVQKRTLPKIELVDLKDTLVDPVERVHVLSQRMAECIAETLDQGEQAILFLNRRGYASFALCKDCGQSVKCNNCSVALVHHLNENCLKCHYCGMSMPVPTRCMSCSGGRIRLFGLGTEKCELEVTRRFPGARVLRMDSDTTNRRGALKSMMELFTGGEADVLIGTQMVTKGHDIPGVTLVGVLLADLSLHMPDFRAAERTFQLLVQVAGRAGRGERPGRVVIQTFLPGHETIGLACKQQFGDFFVREVARRKNLGYPPFRRLLLLRMSHKENETARKLAFRVASVARSDTRDQVQFLGPVVSPLAKLRDRYRWQMLVKSRSVLELQEIAKRIRAEIKLPRGAKIQFDVDPFDML